jgi:type IV pilus assembly protein PilA
MRTTLQSGMQPKQERQDAGFSLIELLVVVAIILILAAIAIPNLLRARMAANESSAATTVRTFTTAAVIYNTTWGNGYPPNIGVLAGPSTGAASCNLAALMDPTVVTAPYQKSGYTFGFNAQGSVVLPTPSDCGTPGSTGFLATATPNIPFITGTRSFCADENGTLHYDTTGATAASETSCNGLTTLQ